MSNLTCNVTSLILLLMASAGRASETPVADLRSTLSQLLRQEPLALPALELRVDVALLPSDLAPSLILSATAEVILPPFKPPQAERTWRKPLAWTMIGLGGASLISGIACWGYGWKLNSDGLTSANDTIETLNLVSAVTVGVGAALAIGGIAVLLWENYVPLTPEVQVSPQGGAIALAGKF